MTSNRTRRLLTLSAVGVVALSGAGIAGASTPPDSTAPAGTETAGTEMAGTEMAGTEAGSSDAVADTATAGATGTAGGSDLAAAGCPETVVIQTDWNPEAEHGWVYEMVGDDPVIDAGTFSVTGPLVTPDGTETNVDIQIRTGGPAIGFQTVTSQLYTDDEILLGYVYTDEGIQNAAEFPTVAIYAGMEKNPQMIMWDPATYPDVEGIADLGEEGVLVRYFGGAAYMEYFVQNGILSADQVDGGYDGTPAGFLAAEGADAQQGFGSAEPYIYENEIADWGQPIAYEYINDAGWENYAESIATRPENLETYAECFTALVPIIQQSSVAYLEDPAETNEVILAAVEAFDTGWVYSEGVAEYAVDTMINDGLIGNGPNETLGDFDLDRVNDLIETARPVYAALGQEPPADLTAEDIVTNEFIDPSIGLPDGLGGGSDDSGDTATMDTDTMDTDTMDTETMDTDTMGTETMDTDTMGTETMGTETMGTETMDTETMDTETTDG